MDKADKEGKYLMVVVDAKDCDHCNEVADKGFADALLGQQLSQKFISIRATTADADWEKLAQQYDLPGGMATLFFTANGVLLHKKTGTTSMAKQYADAAETALTKESEVINLNSLTEAYNQNKKDYKLLQALLLKRKELFLSTDSLLDTYVSLLPADSLQSFYQLQFIARLAPVLQSEANKVLRQNTNLFNQAWHRLDLPTRVRINNHIIYKSRQLAIEDRNEQMAFNVARFASSTNNTPQAKERGYLLNMMEYYKGVNDTLHYFTTASNYYNKFLMTVIVDSVHRKDSLQRVKLLKEAKGEVVNREGDRTVVNKTVSFAPSAQFYMKELNKGAWSFYKMTRKEEHLQTALRWSARALEFFRNPEAMDTHARLLFVTGKKQEAIALETEAIAMQRKLGYSVKVYEAALADMKAGKETID